MSDFFIFLKMSLLSEFTPRFLRYINNNLVHHCFNILIGKGFLFRAPRPKVYRPLSRLL